MNQVKSVKKRPLRDNLEVRHKYLIGGYKKKTETFHEFLDKFLSPDENPLERKTIPNEVITISSDSEARSPSFQNLLKTMLDNPVTERFGLSQVKDEDMPFSQLINVMLTPELSTPTTLSQPRQNEEILSQMSQKDSIEWNSPVRNKKRNNTSDVCGYNDGFKQFIKPSSINMPILSQNSQRDIFASCSFSSKNIINDSQISDQVLTTPANRCEKRFCEMGTQTSFTELLPTNLTRFGAENRNSQIYVNTVGHFLHILSEDISYLPDGRKVFNNISKIATTQWLESALLKLRVYTFKKVDVVDVNEIGNSWALYVDYTSQIVVEREIKDEELIFKIVKKECGSSQNGSNLDEFLERPFCDENLTPSQKEISRKIDMACKYFTLIPQNSQIPVIDKNKILIKIHGLFSKLYEAFANGKLPAIIFKNPVTNGNRKFCIKHSQSRVKFCVMLHVLAKMYYLLNSNTKITKRELYYQMKGFVSSQLSTNNVVYDITCILGINSFHLNILAGKGLVYGNLKIIYASGEVLDCRERTTLIPEDTEHIVALQSNARFILVVEKESIFKKLLDEDFQNKLVESFIMITGKGMPCFTTTSFLNKITKILLIPTFILVDPDPHGIQIMMCYRFGSRKNSHLADSLTVPNAKWMGVFPSEIPLFGMPYQKFTQQDKRVIKTLLNNPDVKKHEKILQEVEFLQKSDKKGSIEGLVKNKSFLSTSYVPTKFFSGNFI